MNDVSNMKKIKKPTVELVKQIDWNDFSKWLDLLIPGSSEQLLEYWDYPANGSIVSFPDIDNYLMDYNKTMYDIFEAINRELSDDYKEVQIYVWW